LKAVILHDDHDEKIHMTQPVGFIIVDLVSRGYVGSRNGASRLLS